MRTVTDFMKHVHPSSMTHEEEREMWNNVPAALFWSKLCDLGSKKATKSVDECRDIYATAPLADEEWDALQAEFDSLCV